MLGFGILGWFAGPTQDSGAFNRTFLSPNERNPRVINLSQGFSLRFCSSTTFEDKGWR